jgi:hypothetical protein
MFATGAVIFIGFVWFTIWNLIEDRNEERENHRREVGHNSSFIDYDGMGNWSRHPSKKSK